MALELRFSVTKPAATSHVQLTAENRQELFALIKDQYPNATDDGTAISWSHYFGGWSVVEGGWVAVGGDPLSVGGALSATDYQARCQEVPTAFNAYVLESVGVPTG